MTGHGLSFLFFATIAGVVASDYVTIITSLFNNVSLALNTLN